jgi:hypothetical protein
LICGKPLPLGSRADRRTDTERCRKALSRREGNGEDEDVDDLAGKITGPRLADGAIVSVDVPAVAQLAALRALVAEVADELEGRQWDDNPVRGCDDLVQRLRGAVGEG